MTNKILKNSEVEEAMKPIAEDFVKAKFKDELDKAGQDIKPGPVEFVERMGPHVYAGVNNVLAELGKIGIAKGRKNQQQNYSFRGIDDVYAALNPLLAEHKLLIKPHVIERNVIERETKSGSVIFYVNLKIRYSFISVLDGSAFDCDVYGEAMDSADKATNKAMSAAYKTLCLQIFCIPTEGASPDADETHHDIVAPSHVVSKSHTQPVARPPEPNTQVAMVKDLLEKIKVAPDHTAIASLIEEHKELMAHIPPIVVTNIMNAVTARETELKGASND